MIRVTSTYILLLAAFSCAAVFAQPSAGHPNVLFISIDDLNDWVGCLGGHPQARTPNIDALAERGVLFTNAHCAAPVCNPSRNAVMTSMYPSSSGFYVNGQSLKSRPDLITLPQYFKENGYQTLGAGKLFHGNNQTGPKDWSQYGPKHTAGGAKGGPFSKDEISSALQNPFNWIERLKAQLPLNGMPSDHGGQGGNSFDWGPVDVSDDDMSDGMVTNWGVKQLKLDHKTPFFLGLGFYRPHIPLYAPRKYFEGLNEADIILPPYFENDLRDLAQSAKEFALLPLTAGTHQNVVAHDEWRGAIAGYLASVRFVDAQVGKVMVALDASPYADNTTIVLWSDHGWHLGEKNHWGRFTGWERATRVPLIVIPPKNMKLEGFEPGTRSSRTVSLVDIFPTLTDLSGLRAHNQVEGNSLVPLLRQPDRKWDTSAITAFGRGNFSVRTEDWRYIRYFDGSQELYNVGDDPNEWINLATDEKHTEVLAKLDAMVPKDMAIRATARHDRWKVVVGKERSGDRLLPHDLPKGLSDEANLLADYPAVFREAMAQISKGDALITEPHAQTGSYEWKWLFHGSSDDMKHWTILPQRGRKKDALSKPITGAWNIQDGALVHRPPGGYLWSKKSYENFVLELEYSVTKNANSGVFFWGQIDDHTNRGIEIQVLDSFEEKEPNFHSMGPLYDARAPRSLPIKPTGEWQHLRIAVDSPSVAVSINHELVMRANLDRWDTAGKNPDGTDNKFKTALGKLPRRGHIALQDHNDAVRYRNIRIMQLPKP